MIGSINVLCNITSINAESVGKTTIKIIINKVTKFLVTLTVKKISVCVLVRISDQEINELLPGAV